MWIAHYSSGKSLSESAGYDWADIPKENITSLQFISPVDGKTYTLSSSSALTFFQLKIGMADWGKPGKQTGTMIGYVFNEQGDCFVLEVGIDKHVVKAYTSNVIDMRMNLKLMGLEWIKQ